MFEGASRNFTPVSKDIVTSGPLRHDTKRRQCTDNNFEICILIIPVSGREKREVGVSQVVKDRTAAALPPGKVHPVRFHFVNFTLNPRILVTPNDDCVIVTPQ